MIETEKTGGLRLCPKLTRDHIWLTSFSRMRVYLAAQEYKLSILQLCKYTIVTRTHALYYE